MEKLSEYHLAHAGHGAPLVGVRVVTFDRAQTGGPVPPAHRVQLHRHQIHNGLQCAVLRPYLVVEHGDARGAALVNHRGHVAPGPGHSVKPLHRVEVAPPVMPAHRVQRPAQYRYTQPMPKQIENW